MEDELNVLPCTLAIEDSLQNSAVPSKPEQSVRLSFYTQLCKVRLQARVLIRRPLSPQFQFKEIVLTEEEKRLLSKEGATIPTDMPLTKVRLRNTHLDLWQMWLQP